MFSVQAMIVVVKVSPMDLINVRVLLRIVCTDPQATVEHALLQADLALPAVTDRLDLSIYDIHYQAEQLTYVLDKSRYQMTLETITFDSWKQAIKRVDDLMHAGFKVRIFPIAFEAEEQAKSAIFANDVAGKRLTAMRINGTWHTLTDEERFWIKFRAESVIFVPQDGSSQVSTLTSVAG